MSKPHPPVRDGATDQEWCRLVEVIGGGKVVGGARYLHISAVTDDVLGAVRGKVMALGGPNAGFNVLKLVPDSPRLSLLNYPSFFELAFPLLSDSWTADFSKQRCEHRAYSLARNPPVLHRKELLLRPDHPRYAEFAALTAEAEHYGLFADTLIIGHRNQWEEIVRARGLRVEGHSLVPVPKPGDTGAVAVQRHRTAMGRKGLSTPMQALWRHGFLAAPTTVFDYGCGRGSDLAALIATGVEARGWDPYYRPDDPRAEADVINLGFVLNVIEDLDERRLALTQAFGLAQRVLAVAALIGGRTAFERHPAYGDGVLTSHNTFQKYFRHEELGEFIATVLQREPVSVGPGLYFVFRRDEDEQDFLEGRQRSSGRFGPMPGRASTLVDPQPAGRPAARPPKVKAPTRWERNVALVEAFWESCISLGRPPREGEFERLEDLTRDVASGSVVLRRLLEQRGSEALQRAKERRMGDLSVFLALNLFERRRSAGSWGARARYDLREFWGSHARATEAVQALLFSLRDPKTIETACVAAAAQGLGWLTPGESLQLDARLVNELPPVLRVYIGCAGKLYGEAQDADMVKIHIASGKVSLMRYDDYDGCAIPMLLERIKVDLRRQQVTYFEYGDEFAPQPLYLKSRYLHPAMEEYKPQRAFDDALLALKQFDWTGYGPSLDALGSALENIELPLGMALMATLRQPRSPPPDRP